MQKMSKRVETYLKRIETCTDHNEIEGIRIAFSQDCSANRLSWNEFMTLYRAQQVKRAQIRSKR